MILYEENGKSYTFEEVEHICSNWSSSFGNDYSANEVTDLFLACLNNFIKQDPDIIYIGDCREFLTDKEKAFLKEIVSKI
jgi:hypothetical protein